MRIVEIFSSLEGEVNPFGQGYPTTFVRLHGCNLDCSYCDTLYAKGKGSYMEIPIATIINEIQFLKNKKITITGGEPLLQQMELAQLLYQIMIADPENFVSIETNGSIPIIKIPTKHRKRISWILDCKLDYMKDMKVNNYKQLEEWDWIKFVIKDRMDFRFARAIYEGIKDITKARIAFSPVAGKLHPKELFNWMQQSKLSDVTLNIQFHKIFGFK